MKHLEFDETSGKVIAAAIEVHKRLGPGFMESLYEQALKLELRKRGIAFESQKLVQVVYDGVVVGNHILDLVVEGFLVVELKAVKALEDVHHCAVALLLASHGMQGWLAAKLQHRHTDYQEISQLTVPFRVFFLSCFRDKKKRSLQMIKGRGSQIRV